MKAVREQAPYVLALDQGGSKCEALLVRADGTVLGWGRASQPGLSGRSVEVMVRAARRALGRRRIRRLHLGTLGCGRKAALLIRRLRPEKLHMFDEFEGPLALCGETCGVVVVAGTGARVTTRTRRGRVLTLDGMGPMLGDVGSGYQIGYQALRATVKAVWHPRHRTRLRDRIFDACEELAKTHPREDNFLRAPRGMKGVMAYSVATKAIHSKLDPSASRLHNLIDFSLLPHDRSVIASLAHIVNEEAEAGDRVAVGILRDAAAGLAETVHDAVDRLKIAREPYLFVGTGSVAMHSDIYWRHLCRQVRKFAPHFRPRRSPYPPVVGNALCALLQLNHRDPASLRRQLFDSFKHYEHSH